MMDKDHLPSYNFLPLEDPRPTLVASWAPLGKACVLLRRVAALLSSWSICWAQTTESGTSGSCLDHAVATSTRRPQWMGDEAASCKAISLATKFGEDFKPRQEERWDLRATSISSWWLQPALVTSSFSWVPHGVVMISIYWFYNIKLPWGNGSSITFRFLTEIQSEICTEINIFQEKRKQAKPSQAKLSQAKPGLFFFPHKLYYCDANGRQNNANIYLNKKKNVKLDGNHIEWWWTQLWLQFD